MFTLTWDGTMLGEIVAWVGLAIWGGALVAFVVVDLGRTYQHHHHPVAHRAGHSESRWHKDPR